MSDLPSPGETAGRVSIGELARVFGRIGCLSFGGPAAQFSLMHREVVDGKRWLDEGTYLKGLGFCMVLPGPEAMQLATWIGWRLRGVAGGLVAGGLFVLPGAALILALALLYDRYGSVPLVQEAFLGIKAAVLAIVAEAVVRIGRRALTRTEAWAIAAAAFGALLAGVPYPLVILGAALWGALRLSPAGRSAPAPLQPATGALGAAGALAMLWAVPIVLAWLAGAELLVEIGLFFSWLAVISFGGAYAVLAYLTDAAIGFGWVTPAQMIDALGLAETTPGPLILVTEFVAALAGLKEGTGIGILTALMCLWVTFVPCFLWIFAFAPFLDRITAQPRLQGALLGITAAVVGVILSLGVFFAGHVLFPGGDVSLRAAGLAALSAVLLLGLHWPLPAVLGTLAAAGLASAAMVS